MASEAKKTLREIRAYNWAETMMLRHGLINWKLKFDNADRRGGRAHFGLIKFISISRKMVNAISTVSWPEIKNVILHEIAHGVAGVQHGHDASWKAVAKSIGCTADRCHTLQFGTAKYVLKCGCTAWRKPRKPKKYLSGTYRCRTCKQPIRVYEVGVDGTLEQLMAIEKK